MSWTGNSSAEKASDTPEDADNASIPPHMMFTMESGIQKTSMSTCTLQEEQINLPLHTMNELKDMPSSASLADMDEGPAPKRLKVDDTRFPALGISNNSASSLSSLARVASAEFMAKGFSSALSIHVSDSSASLRKVSHASVGSSATPQVTTTSASGSSTSGSSLDAHHFLRSGASAKLAQPAPTSEHASDSGPLTSEPPTSALHPASSTPQTALPASPSSPLKATTMLHLHQKYTAELDYMLREFRKLERQLLGAKVSGTGVEESAGSRERREKLHSFILHLEDTLRQIKLGCQLEAEGKSTVMVGVTVGESAAGGKKGPSPTETDVKQKLAESGALTILSKEKEEEENVQKLEEHILADLLPVKVRLKKQLAAQQGASRNPVGMPAARRGMLPSASAEKGTGTFAAAAEQRRRQAEAAAAESSEETQFGKALGGGASSLTQKLHGQTLGSSSRTYGYGVGSEKPTDSNASEAEVPQVDGESAKKRKILYAGMAPGSNQHQSGVLAASCVHKLVIETPGLYRFSDKQKPKGGPKVPESALSASIRPSEPATLPQHSRGPGAEAARQVVSSHPGQLIVAASDAALKKPAARDAGLFEEDRKKLKKLKKLKMRRKLQKQRERERHLRILRQQQSVPPKVTGKRGGKSVAGKNQGKKKGPRTVEYICALCGDVYNSTCDCNPWWALTSHDCPKCRKNQVPRIDITSPANAIEYHPALLAHAEENGSSGGSGAACATAHGPGVMHIHPSHISSSTTFPISNSMPNRQYPVPPSDSDSSGLSDISDGDLSDDSYDSDDSLDALMGIMSPAEQAENEEFGFEYSGPKLTDDQTSRLLVLMSHASTCHGRHKHAKHRDVCNSVKYLMLHVRDCPGTTSTSDICPFPWCRKVKNMLYHLVACARPKDCPICAPTELSPNLSALVGLNNHRQTKQRERRDAAMAAAAAAAITKKPPVSPQMIAKPTTAPVRPVMTPKGIAATASAIQGGYRPPVGKPVTSTTLATKNDVKPVPATHPSHLPAAGKPPEVSMSAAKGPTGAEGAEAAKFSLAHASPTPRPPSHYSTAVGIPAKHSMEAAASSQLAAGVPGTSTQANPLSGATVAAASTVQIKPPLQTTTAEAASFSSTAQGKPSPNSVVAPNLVESGGETTQTAKSATNESVSVTHSANETKVCSAVHEAGVYIAVTQASRDDMPKANDDKTILPGSENVVPTVEATALPIQEELNPPITASLAESHTGEASVEMKLEEEPVASSTSVADSSMVKSETMIEAKPANEETAAQDEKPRGSPPTRSQESSSGMTSSCSGEFKNNTDIVRISC